MNMDDLATALDPMLRHKAKRGLFDVEAQTPGMSWSNSCDIIRQSIAWESQFRLD